MWVRLPLLGGLSEILMHHACVGCDSRSIVLRVGLRPEDRALAVQASPNGDSRSCAIETAQTGEPALRSESSPPWPTTALGEYPSTKKPAASFDAAGFV